MIEHLIILFTVILVIFNFWLVIYIKQKFNIYRHLFVKQLYYLIAIFLAFYILKYFNVYITKNINNELINRFSNYIEFIWNLLRIFVIYIIVNFLLTIRNIKVKRTYNYIVLAIFGLIATFSIIYFFPSNKLFSFSEYLLQIIGNYHIAIKINILIAFCFFSKKVNKDIIKMSRSFSILFICAYSFSLIIEIFDNNAVVNNITLVVLNAIRWFCFLLAPLFWMKFIYVPYAESLKGLLNQYELYEYVFKKFNISIREQDIIKLIIDGKNNNEIKDELFISYHTVKNHLTNIYKKFNIKNRHELLNFLVKEKDKIIL